MEVVYARNHHPIVTDGRRFQNARLFTGPLAGATKVFIVGDEPRIAAAYDQAGVQVVHVDGVEPRAQLEALLALPGPLSEDERAKVYIPEDWRDLPWSKPTDVGLTLRGLGAVFADGPVINKKQAAAAIEAEVERRGAD